MSYEEQKDKIRVVHVVNSFATGGLEKGVATLVRNASQNMEHKIVCLTHSGKTERLLPSGTEILELKKQPGNSVRFLWKLSRTLCRLNPDIVHTRNWSGTDGVIAARLAGIRSVVHGEHGFTNDNPAGKNRRRIWLYRCLSPWVKEYTCVSRPLKRWLKEEVGVWNPVTQIYNGVDTDVYRPGPGAHIRRKLEVSQKAFIIGIVGSLSVIKDYPTMLRAFEIFRRHNPDAILVVVGDGPERSYLHSMAGPRVVFLGNRIDVPELLRCFDVYVSSSKNEGISNTILEAMATGLPVVATSVGGTPELIENGVTGTLFPAGDEKSLASALLMYSTSEDLRIAHGIKGKNRAVSIFSIDAMVRGYETVWTRVSRSASKRHKSGSH